MNFYNLLNSQLVTLLKLKFYLEFHLKLYLDLILVLNLFKKVINYSQNINTSV